MYWSALCWFRVWIVCSIGDLQILQASLLCWGIFSIISSQHLMKPIFTFRFHFPLQLLCGVHNILFLFRWVPVYIPFLGLCNVNSRCNVITPRIILNNVGLCQSSCLIYRWVLSLKFCIYFSLYLFYWFSEFLRYLLSLHMEQATCYFFSSTPTLYYFHLPVICNNQSLLRSNLYIFLAFLFLLWSIYSCLLFVPPPSVQLIIE